MRVRPDPFIVALVATAAVATLVPVSGGAASALWWVSKLAVALLFFSYGVRLRTRDMAAALAHWRLHAAVLASTFVIFPLLGLAAMRLVDDQLATGMLLLAVVPSTMQSSVVFTSMAKGNVAGAVVSASASNIVGVVITPLLVATLIGGSAAVTGTAVAEVALILLAPIAAGQIARPTLYRWAERHDAVLRGYDRATVLVIVFLAFSEGRTHHVWSGLGASAVLALVAACVGLVLVMFAWTGAIARGFAPVDRPAIVFCGSHKSLSAGLPMASILFGTHDVALIVLPLMLYHQIQLMASAWLAGRWAR